MFDKPGRQRTAVKPRPSRMRFLLIYFAVVTGICVALAGWKGLLVAPVLILWAFSLSLRRRRSRSAVGTLMDQGDREFDKMRREEIARRRARDGGTRSR